MQPYELVAILFSLLVNVFALGIIMKMTFSIIYKDTLGQQQALVEQGGAHLYLEYALHKAQGKTFKFRWTSQTACRLWTYVCCFLTNITNILIMVLHWVNTVEWNSAVDMCAGGLYMLAALFVGLTYSLYISILIYRYERIFMVLHESRPYHCLRSYLLLVLILNASRVIVALVYYSTHMVWPVLSAEFEWVAVWCLNGLLFVNSGCVIGTEVFVNYRLVSCSLRNNLPHPRTASHFTFSQGKQLARPSRVIHTTNIQEPILDTVATMERRKSQLKHRMLFYLFFLIVSDVLVLSFYVIGNARILPKLETSALCSLWIILHVFIAFRFLDLFLHQLKKKPSVIQQEHHDHESAGLSRSEIVADSLLPESTDTSSH